MPKPGPGLLSRDRIISLTVLLISILLYAEAGDYPDGGSLFPRFSLAVVAGLAVLMLLFSFMKGSPAAQQSADSLEKSSDEESGTDSRRRPIIMVGIFFVYLIVAPWLGFFVSTAVFIYVVMAYLRIQGVWLYALAVPAYHDIALCLFRAFAESALSRQSADLRFRKEIRCLNTF